MKFYTYEQAMTDPSLPVGKMLMVHAASVPRKFRNLDNYPEPVWRELCAPMKLTHYSVTGAPPIPACEFGCKIYVRRQGATIRYAVLHSLTYGHSHSPNVR